MNNTDERIPAEGMHILEDLKSFLKNKSKIKEQLAHIRKPYSVSEIRKMFLSGEYSAELLLQHAMIHINNI